MENPSGVNHLHVSTKIQQCWFFSTNSNPRQANCIPLHLQIGFQKKLAGNSHLEGQTPRLSCQKWHCRWTDPWLPNDPPPRAGKGLRISRVCSLEAEDFSHVWGLQSWGFREIYRETQGSFHGSQGGPVNCPTNPLILTYLNQHHLRRWPIDVPSNFLPVLECFGGISRPEPLKGDVGWFISSCYFVVVFNAQRVPCVAVAVPGNKVMLPPNSHFTSYIKPT